MKLKAYLCESVFLDFIIMNTVVQRLISNKYYTKSAILGKLVFITGGIQAIISALGLLSGVLIIRLLPTQEYALYTLINTTLGTMIILADGGITTGVLAQGGQVWQSKEKLGLVIATGLDLRKKFAIGSLLLATPILLYLLRLHGASWSMSGLLILALVPAFITSLSDGLLQVAPKLKQDITSVQKNELGANIGRLITVVLVLFTFPLAFMIILAAGIPQIWVNLRLRKISAGYAEINQYPDPAIRKEILNFVKRILPYSIYYCVSSQTTIWLISVFGNTTSLAQVGALGRLTMILSIFTTVFGMVITPRFARLEKNSKDMLGKFLAIQALLFAFSTCVVGIVYLFPTQILWVLGKGYAGLRTELLLSVISSCGALIAGISYSLYTSRGWAIKPLIAISINITTTILAAVVLDIKTLRGVLLLGISIETVQIIMNILFAVTQIKRTIKNNQ